MKVRDRITLEEFSVDEAYERFFDGYYDLGRPGEIFERAVVLAPPKRRPIIPAGRAGKRSSLKRRARRACK